MASAPWTPNGLPAAAALAWITALSMPPVTKELTIEPRFMFGTDLYMEALNPNANQFLTEATNIAVSAVLVDGMPVDCRHRAVRAPRDDLTA